MTRTPRATDPGPPRTDLRAREALQQAVEAAGPQLLTELLDLELIDDNLYRGSHLVDEPFALYGGQIAAQAVMAAGRTVEPGRALHSIHGYFLRPGDVRRPTVYEVFRDRDGRSYTARRVIALQGGEVIFNMSASFAAPQPGLDRQETAMPPVDPPTGPSRPLPRLYSYEVRTADPSADRLRFPDRFWSRCTADLGDDPLLHAAALTYLSDISSGLARFEDEDNLGGSSLDHAVWFHVPARADQWLLSHNVPERTAGGRGLYTCGLFTESGELVATIAQETLFRPVRR